MVSFFLQYGTLRHLINELYGFFFSAIRYNKVEQAKYQDFTLTYRLVTRTTKGDQTYRRR